MSTRSGPRTHTLAIQERFNPRLIPALYNNFRSSLEALLELIDNAVDDRIDGQPLIVEINHRRGTLTVNNHGGMGMALRELEGFLEWGGSAKRGKLGRYGQGGKAAIGYLGRSWEIWCKREGEKEAFRIVDNDWHDRPWGLKSYTPERLETEESQGVVSLRIWNLHRKLNLNQLAVKLGELYKPWVITRRVIFRINGREITPANVPIAAHTAIPIFVPIRPAFDCPICGREAHMIRSSRCSQCGMVFVVTGWVGRLEPDATIRGGLRCFSYGRMIAAEEYFGHPDALERHSMSCLYGEVLFDFVPMILNKTGYQRESPAWRAVYDAISLQIAPVVNAIINGETRQEVPEFEMEAAEHASRLIRSAMRSIQAKNPTAVYDGRPSAASSHNPRSVAPTATVKPPGPVLIDAASTLGHTRSKGNLQIELNSLDPTRRAAVINRGYHHVLIINRDFPAYKLAGGGLAYLLETACLELVKLDGADEHTAAELIDRAALLLSESSSIALKRQKGRRRLKGNRLSNSAPIVHSQTSGVRR